MERADAVKKELERISRALGASLFGVADVGGIKKEFLFQGTVLRDLDCAVSVGMRLSRPILDEIVDHPTKIYFHHYRQINMALDQLALKVSNFIQSKGHKAMPVPASQIVDWEKQTAHLSHKKIGLLAGLGHIGRNNLLVNPEFGAQFRLVTILTDLRLEPDRPLDTDCADCMMCVNRCPANAIKEKKDDFDHIRCYEKLKEFRDKRLTDQFICGVCVKACAGRSCK